jgi:N-acyl-L-homoserine lactone synthetase
MGQNDFTLYFKPVTNQKELDLCYEIRYQVYCEEKKWLNAADYPDKKEKDEYDSKALHYIALDENYEIVGMMRILRSTDFEKLPFSNHPAYKGSNPGLTRSAELSRFIVTATKNRNEVIKGLFRTIYQNSKNLELDSWVILVEPSLLRYFTRFYYFCEPLTSPSMYFGALTYPALCDIKKHEKIWANQHPENYMFNMADYRQLTNVPELVF